MTNRWRCPECKRPEVEISIPTWYVETTDYKLTQPDPDLEAEILYWYCRHCGASDSGKPEENEAK